LRLKRLRCGNLVDDPRLAIAAEADLARAK
jgi:hypothetical protein